jgi:hypothetical protein
MDVSETELTGLRSSVARARTADRPGAFSPQMDGYRALPRRGDRRVGPIVPMLRGIRRIPAPADVPPANPAARPPRRSLKRRSLPIT